MKVTQEYYQMTHAEVGKALGLSRGMVNHIEKKAMRKIIEILKRRGIKLEDIL
jgi:DNA-directed RNA polymerase sigma subunit (sigma70/sigma32)